MRKTILAVIAIGGWLFCNCSGKQTQVTEMNDDSLKVSAMTGDSAIYGLACDGCTDSVIVLLPHDGSDPVTYDILKAMRNKRVIGRPKIGDHLAVLLSQENPTEAVSVVDIDEMKGSWVYQVMPTLKKSFIENAGKRDAETDSMIKKLMVPREYGFKLKRDKQVSNIGMTYRPTTSDDDNPVDYPPLTRYSEWHIFNGKLILVRAKNRIGNSQQDQQPAIKDTAEIVFMMKDSLQLRFKDEVRNYYRKTEEK